MSYIILSILGLLFTVVVSSIICKKIINKITINRWFVALAAVLVIFIPNIIFNLNTIMMNSLLVVFIFLSILFFEMSNMHYEIRREKFKQINNKGIELNKKVYSKKK